MQIFRHFHQAANFPLAVAIGNFDGVHLGHQALLQRLIEVAAAQGLKSAVMTFEPHPREFFAPDRAPTRLTSLREKLELFAEAGVDYVYVCHFNRRFAAMSVQDFMQNILRSSMDARAILVGDDFRFGAGRQGGKEDFIQAGFSLQSQPQIDLDGQRVSSTAVREALSQGRLDDAARLLGRPYSISGKVVHGDKLARELGFPTANIHMLHDRPPLFGIYAVKLAGFGDDPASDWPGVASLGVRPTVKQNGRPTLEVHLFDFNGNLYGKHVRVKFLRKIRDEMKFDSLETLKYWIANDAEQARAYFRLSL